MTTLEMVRETFNFSIDKFPLSGPEGMRTPHYGLFRSDNGQPVGKAVTKRYVPHTTDDILALCEAAAAAFEGDLDARCHWNNGHYLTLAPSREHRLAIFGTNDNIFPRVLIRAGYDGNAFRASMGWYRDACKNLSIPKCAGRETCVKIRHTHSLRGKMTELVRTFGALRNSWDNVAEQAQQMQQRRVDMREFLNAIYPQPEVWNSGRERTIHENRTEQIIRRLLNEQRQTGRERSGFEVSAWEAYNAVQGYVQHDATRHGQPNAFERMLAAQKSEPVKVAERLAMGLAV